MTNDVHSENFESKLDPFFTSEVKSDRWGKYSSWGKDEARSALAPTRKPRSRDWCKGELGVRSPLSKDDG